MRKRPADRTHRRIELETAIDLIAIFTEIPAEPEVGIKYPSYELEGLEVSHQGGNYVRVNTRKLAKLLEGTGVFENLEQTAEELSKDDAECRLYGDYC